ncbi:hypothetical protein F511_09951 [Dorcoceras hygrometricum]|uniref:Uncharacterized protein n=1 Tax=Dorcoceras hygrometricum TaxID=472368 RepID=A0A2Z7ABV9_9LAMI|nr:hypothetical protein F511_09951 [Dorcoceras hygrometricum]
MVKSSQILFVVVIYACLLSETSLVFGSSVSEHIARRPDPLRKFKRYGGDYDVRNKHYWASAAFMGIHGYAVAGLWLLCGIGFGIYIIAKNSCGATSQIVEPQHSSHLFIFLLLVLLTIFSIIGGSVAIAANQKSMEGAKKLEKTLCDAGNDAHQAIGEVKNTLLQIQTVLLPYDSKTCKLLDFITRRLRKGSLSIQKFIAQTRKSYLQAIQTLYVVNLVVVSVHLASLSAGLVLRTLQYRPGLILLIFSCWILTTMSWILTGIDFVFYTFMSDTCSSLKDFEQIPQNNSLADMLPCPKSVFSDGTLMQIGYTVHSFISQINFKISELRMSEVFEKNESKEDREIQGVCDPFSGAPKYTYSPENCGHNCIPVGDIPTILSRFVCFEANSSGNCEAEGRLILPEGIYSMTLAYCQSIQDLMNIYPDLSKLMSCSYVQEAFSDIVLHQCGPMKLQTRLLWSAMLGLSICMVILVWIWCEKVIQDRERCYNRCSFSPRPV